MLKLVNKRKQKIVRLLRYTRSDDETMESGKRLDGFTRYSPDIQSSSRSSQSVKDALQGDLNTDVANYWTILESIDYIDDLHLSIEYLNSKGEFATNSVGVPPLGV